MNSKMLKLAKMILQLETVKTDKGELIADGPIEAGAEVFVEDENGETVPAPDGEYETEEKVIKVVEGRVAEVVDKATDEQEAPEPIEEPIPAEPAAEEPMEEEVPAEPAAEEPEVDPRDEQIAGLQDRIAELEAENEALKAELEAAKAEKENLNSQLKMSAAEPLKNTEKENKKVVLPGVGRFI